MSKKSKKSSHKNKAFETIVLITAITNLINSLILLIEKFIN